MTDASSHSTIDDAFDEMQAEALEIWGTILLQMLRCWKKYDIERAVHT